MAIILEHRSGPDRRRRPRGGRRQTDRPGFSPLVLLVGKEPEMNARSEAVLVRLRFAVSIADSADAALRALPELRPDSRRRHR